MSLDVWRKSTVAMSSRETQATCCFPSMISSLTFPPYDDGSGVYLDLEIIAIIASVAFAMLLTSKRLIRREPFLP